MDKRSSVISDNITNSEFHTDSMDEISSVGSNNIANPACHVVDQRSSVGSNNIANSASQGCSYSLPSTLGLYDPAMYNEMYFGAEEFNLPADPTNQATNYQPLVGHDRSWEGLNWSNNDNGSAPVDLIEEPNLPAAPTHLHTNYQPLFSHVRAWEGLNRNNNNLSNTANLRFPPSIERDLHFNRGRLPRMHQHPVPVFPFVGTQRDSHFNRGRLPGMHQHPVPVLPFVGTRQYEYQFQALQRLEREVFLWKNEYFYLRQEHSALALRVRTLEEALNDLRTEGQLFRDYNINSVEWARDLVSENKALSDMVNELRIKVNSLQLKDVIESDLRRVNDDMLERRLVRLEKLVGGIHSGGETTSEASESTSNWKSCIAERAQLCYEGLLNCGLFNTMKQIPAKLYELVWPGEYADVDLLHCALMGR